jgi:protein-disulfide isomerase
MRRYLPFVIIGAVLAIAVASVLLFTRARNANESQFSTPPPATNTTSTSDNSSSSNTPTKGANPYAPLGSSSPGATPPHVRGAANARITLEEFGDYQCPPCGALFRELKKIEGEYHDRLRLIFRHYPITDRHKHALIAAHAAEAAGLQNKYWEMHDRLYETQADWAEAENAREIFIKYASELGLDVERFKRDLDNPASDARIEADRQRAQALGVQGTPTLFVNGRQLKPEAMTPEMMRKAIDFMLDPKNQ